MIQERTAGDPRGYDGPIQSANGTRPYNYYLWPTESWWVTHQPQFRNVWGQYHFGFVALHDDRFTTDGSVFAIQSGFDCYDRPCVFATREAAIRHSAARMIRHMRSAMRSERPNPGNDVETVQDMINWTRRAVAGACNAPTPRPVTLPIPPPPRAPRPEDGLPLRGGERMTMERSGIGGTLDRLVGRRSCNTCLLYEEVLAGRGEHLAKRCEAGCEPVSARWCKSYVPNDEYTA